MHAIWDNINAAQHVLIIKEDKKKDKNSQRTLIYKPPSNCWISYCKQSQYKCVATVRCRVTCSFFVTGKHRWVLSADFSMAQAVKLMTLLWELLFFCSTLCTLQIPNCICMNTNHFICNRFDYSFWVSSMLLLITKKKIHENSSVILQTSVHF